MKNKLINLNEYEIKNKIFSIRGLQVMLDSDLAEIYGVKVRVLNQAVKRNILRFPDNFMFRLMEKEYEPLRSQNVILKRSNSLRLQNGTLENERGKHRKYLPYAFTEQGVAMLSGVLKSETAVRISVQIMTAFVSMRRFISSNAQVFQRLDTIEQKQIIYDKKFEQVFDAIQSKDLKPEKGIFFDGQVFDAYQFVSDLIRGASKSIVLIDNYVDDSIITLLHKRNKNVKVRIFTKFSKQFLLDVEKYNAQYSPIEVHEFKLSHDRFLIIDNRKVYHFGASLKDLGKKWFAFSKFDKEALTLLEKLA
ncbi:ORF6N domain-containing protein [Candidatus Woesearchaeota archaeon]|nr:ORF6N domain-containing protein [Candidatus Woesearchaeota archaeon]